MPPLPPVPELVASSVAPAVLASSPVSSGAPAELASSPAPSAVPDALVSSLASSAGPALLASSSASSVKNENLEKIINVKKEWQNNGQNSHCRKVTKF